jgi:tetratricopeptide (TPR) repeat protein
MKWLAIACGACLCLCLGTVWFRLQSRTDVAIPTGAVALAGERPLHATDRAAALAAARRSCDAAALDRFVADQRALVERSPDDPAGLRLLAESLLERVLLRNQLRGMVVGQPLYSEVPPATAADLDDALEALRRARGLGDDSAANYRLEAALLGNKITGFGTALQWNGRIEEALARAAQKDERDPALHVTLGLRRLLAPSLLGHDADKALQHLEYAATAMADDERPRVFAAMAAYLLKKRQQAVAWLEQAVAQNPHNVYARAVLRRVQRGEPEPFARDVTPAEAEVR